MSECLYCNWKVIVHLADIFSSCTYYWQFAAYTLETAVSRKRWLFIAARVSPACTKAGSWEW